VINPPHFAPMPAPAVMPTPLSNEVIPPSVMPKLEPLLAEESSAQAPLGTQFGYLPLVWVNESFDRAVGTLPGVGGLLRSQGGRGMLGFFGIVLSAAAFGWLLKDLLGWN
jgi:hypothetical protein